MDRTAEHLVTSDRGVNLYHNLLFENIDKVELGEEPMGVVRDPRVNTPMIEIRHESVARAPFSIGRPRDEETAGVFG